MKESTLTAIEMLNGIDEILSHCETVTEVNTFIQGLREVSESKGKVRKMAIEMEDKFNV